MDIFDLDKGLNGTGNNTSEEGAFGRRPVTILVIYGTMALFWFLYIIFLYKICRCYFKDKWRKEEEKFLQARKKRLMAIRNGHCLSASEKTDQVLGQIDQNEIRQDSGERKDKDQKELKVAFNLPEEKEEKHENYNELVIPSSKIETEIPKIDFVEYI